MGKQRESFIRNFIRALRLPFVSASVLPFVFGSLIDRSNFDLLRFFLGLAAAAATHLSANVMNDYADSKSGADWQDKNFYPFFGGSKLIQEKVFSEKFYLILAILFASFAAFCVGVLAFLMRDARVIGYYLIIIALGWSYSAKPLQLSYRKMGEIIIFLLFGPALVMGGYFIQTGIFPDLRSFVLSLPCGFFVAAILFSSEIPDFPEDRLTKKYTWVSLVGPGKAFVLYYMLLLLGFSSVVAGFYFGYLKPLALLSFIFIFPAFKAALILRENPRDKVKLMQSSQLTIMVHTMVGITLILGVW